MVKFKGFGTSRSGGSKIKKMFAGVQPTDRSDEEYRTAFKMFDRDGDGTITRGEIQKVLSTLGQEATQEELDMLMGDDKCLVTKPNAAVPSIAQLLVTGMPPTKL
ncbi:hypothetical protein ACHWQZ_G017379 [Mnemiopsis leidyi]